MREIIGFDNGDSILAPGGTISNMYGLLCARHKHFPGNIFNCVFNFINVTKYL